MEKLWGGEGAWVVVLLGLLAGMLAPAQVAADTSRDSDPIAEIQAEKPRPSAKVCKRVKPTGSHIRQRICLRQKEWEAMARESQRALNEGSMGPKSDSEGSPG